MHESTEMGRGWGRKKFHGDGAGMGLIFTTVSLFNSLPAISEARKKANS